MKRMPEDMCPSVYTNFPIDTTVDAHALDSAVIKGYLEAKSEKVYTQNEVVTMLEDLKKKMNPIKECEYQIYGKEHWNFVGKCQDVVQQKISALKGDTNEEGT